MRGEGIILINLAQLLAITNDIPQAVAHAETALKIFEHLGDPNAAQVRAALAVWREQS